ncbi:MAG: hypothetical protein B6229_03090 [Spirochaetaceae bacterium 4572_7]|nr:MAG: hypothetical protein B6229_03090 [Spirochaetaceae bacterium 4572_7]
MKFYCNMKRVDIDGCLFSNHIFETSNKTKIATLKNNSGFGKYIKVVKDELPEEKFTDEEGNIITLSDITLENINNFKYNEHRKIAKALGLNQSSVTREELALFFEAKLK